MLKKQADIALAIDGTISEVQASKITLCLSHMDDIKSYIAQIEATAIQLSASYSGDRGKKTRNQTRNAEHLTSWVLPTIGEGV